MRKSSWFPKRRLRSAEVTEILVSERALNPHDPYEICDSVAYFQRICVGGCLYEPDELPFLANVAEAINGFIGNVMNGGVEQFLANTSNSPGGLRHAVPHIEKGFELIGAHQHAALFQRLVTMLDNDPAKARGMIMRGGFIGTGYGPIDEDGQEISRAFFDLDQSLIDNPLSELILKSPETIVISVERFDSHLRRLKSCNTAYKRRYRALDNDSKFLHHSWVEHFEGG